MPDALKALTRVIAAVGETGLGLILAAVPLALWVAWSPFVFALVLAVGIASVALLIAWPYLLPSCDEVGESPRRVAPLVALPGEFVEELHRIFPLTYHHSLKERARFRRAMEKIRPLVR